MASNNDEKPLTTYTVSWMVEVDAASIEEAAQEAWDEFYGDPKCSFLHVKASDTANPYVVLDMATGERIEGANLA